MNKIRSKLFGVLTQFAKTSNTTFRNISRTPTLSDIPSPKDIAIEACEVRTHKGLVVGLYTNPDDIMDVGTLTATGQRYNSHVNNRIMELLHYTGPPPEKGVVRIFYNVDKSFDAIAVVGLGRQCQGYDVFEQMDENKEAIRIAAAAGCQALQELHVRKICVDSFGHSESAAEGAALGAECARLLVLR